MTEALDDAIKDIVIKHGVLIGKDDPILILHTMNERLIEENKKQQQALLAQLKEEIEQISSDWQNDAKDKAEAILNQSLVASKKLISKMTLEATNENLVAIKTVIVDSVNECRRLNQKARTANRFSMIACSCLLVASFLFASFSYFGG